MHSLRMKHGENSAHLGMVKNRQSIINIVIAGILLFLAIQVSDSGFATISNNLHRILYEKMDNANAYFTDFDDNNITYESSQVTFNPAGMAGLYSLTNAFLKAVLREDIDVSGKLHLLPKIFTISIYLKLLIFSSIRFNY